jgi:hypothetical protein
MMEVHTMGHRDQTDSCDSATDDAVTAGCKLTALDAHEVVLLAGGYAMEYELDLKGQIIDTYNGEQPKRTEFLGVGINGSIDSQGTFEMWS